MTNEPSGMFEAIYAAAETGGDKPPWDYGAPRPQLVEWAAARGLPGAGRKALVVGCGYGADAELLARLGFRTTGFDFAPTAIAAARRRYPASEVDYLVADVLDLPREWKHRFDLVVESLTVQSMPPEQHRAAAQNIAALVAPGGTLLVLATTRDERTEVKGPPWPLTRAEIDEFAHGDLILRRVERIENGAWWRAELSRGGTGSTSQQLSLDRLLGTWDFTMHHSTRAEPVTGRQRYERVLDGAYVLLTWTYDHPDFPDAMAMLSPESMYYFDVRGVTRVFDLQIDEAGWSTVRLDAEFSQRNTARFDGPDAMDTDGEYSSDRGATWQHDFTMRSIRVA